MCRPGTVASTIGAPSGQTPERPLGFTVIAICDVAWTLPTYEQRLEYWSRGLDAPSLATSLLHELQHADGVVGLDHICEDYTYDVIRYKTLFTYLKELTNFSVVAKVSYHTERSEIRKILSTLPATRWYSPILLHRPTPLITLKRNVG
jgi:hypothetical protein